jgi:hypothetical protein
MQRAFSLLLIFFFVFQNGLFSQNIEETKLRIEKLTSPEFHGRGYVNGGAEISAKYLRDQMIEIGLKPFKDSYFQNFTYDVNSFPYKIKVKIDDKVLIPGVDYLIGPATSSLKEEYQLYIPDSVLLNDTIKFIETVKKNDFSTKMLVLDYAQTQNVGIKMFYIKIMRSNYLKFAGIVELIPEELMWSVSTTQQNFPVVKIKREAFPKNSQTIAIDVKTKFIEDFEAKNVIGYIEGKTDKFIVFTAHYDHLGQMGKNVFIPGANDNASGSAMLLDFAEYYSKNKPEYSIAFMLFYGEEAGLLGSMNYIYNPLFELSKIKAVINLDMIGTGDDGITVVNAAAKGYEGIWNLIQQINLDNEYFTVLKARDESANSDHYPFHKIGIPAIFIYSMGGKTYYHNPKDKLETLTFTGYNQLFGLLTKFVEDYE